MNEVNGQIEGVPAALGADGQLHVEADTAELREQYKRLVSLRNFELAAEGLGLPLWATAAGEEALFDGLASSLRDGDRVFVGGRDRGLALALGRPIEELLGQLLRPDTAPGEPDWTAPSGTELWSEPARWGAQLLLATGHAHAQQRLGSPNLVVAICGEASTALGEWHEALAWALAADLPILFVVKSYTWDAAPPPEAGVMDGGPAERARARGIQSERADGADPVGTQRALNTALDRLRRGEGPALLELVCTPQRGSCPPERDPVERLRRYLDAQGDWSQTFQDVIEAEPRGRFQKAISKLEAAGLIEGGEA